MVEMNESCAISIDAVSLTANARREGGNVSEFVLLLLTLSSNFVVMSASKQAAKRVRRAVSHAFTGLTAWPSQLGKEYQAIQKSPPPFVFARPR